MSGTTDDPDGLAGDSADVPAEHTRPPDPSDPTQAEAAWQQIVAELSDLSTNPDTERTPAPHESTPSFNFPIAPWVLEPAPVTSDPRAWVRSPEAEALDDADDTFVPPDPGPMLSTDRMRNLGWFAVVAAPVAAIMAAMFWSFAPSELFLALSAVFLAGVGVLFWRLPDGSDDGPGSGGAVV